MKKTGGYSPARETLATLLIVDHANPDVFLLSLL